MGGFWRLNGTELTDVGVRVYPTRLTNEQRLRQVRTSIHQGTQDRELVGIDLPTLAVDFTFIGRGDPKFDMLAFVQNILDDDEVWTLEAPSDLPVFVYKNLKRVAMSTDGWNLDNKKAVSSVALAVQATVNGAWIADGGTYCEPTAGWFTFQANGTYLRNDGVNTGNVPLVRLPEQTGGYPIATELSTFLQMQVPIISTVFMVDGRPYFDFDISQFLHPEPVATGDVGVYELCSSPSDDFLDSGEEGDEEDEPEVLDGAVIIVGLGSGQLSDVVVATDQGLRHTDSIIFTENETITNT